MENQARSSLWVKVVVMAVLSVGLVVPLFMIDGVISERGARMHEAESEIYSKWGESQRISGPMINVPYRYWFTTKVPYANGTMHDETRSETSTMHFLAETLEVDGKTEVEIRNRGMYRVPVYVANLKFKAKFKMPRFDEARIPDKDIYWQDATVSLGISDLKGVQSAELKWAGQKMEIGPGTGVGQSQALVFRVGNLGKSSEFLFEGQLSLRGSRELNFMPDGKQAEIRLSSNWATPSFQGARLPDTREIDTQGFRATWRSTALARSYPQVWAEKGVDPAALANSASGVGFVIPIDLHQKSSRAVKYGFLFISLTFLLFFIFEVLNRTRVHPMQYCLVGFGLCLFYLLLISLAEHLGFFPAYGLATLATVGMITGYARSFIQKAGQRFLLSGLLVTLYGFLFTLLQAEDYALLMGSAGLFIILAAVMRATRQVDWYRL